MTTLVTRKLKDLRGPYTTRKTSPQSKEKKGSLPQLQKIVFSTNKKNFRFEGGKKSNVILQTLQDDIKNI